MREVAVRRGLAVAAGLTLVAAFAAALVLAARGSSAGGEGRLESHGAVRIVPPHGLPFAVTAAAPLRAGDTVQVFSGSAVVSLPHGDTIEMRGGDRVTTVLFDHGPHLDAGDALVEAGRHPLSLGDRSASVTVAGVARVRRDLALTVASYRGVSTVAATGRNVRVPAFRQVVLAAVGLLPDHPAPLALDPADGWDRRFLGAAMDLTAQLDATSAGFTNSVASRAASATFFRQVVAGLRSEPRFTDVLLRATDAPLGAVRPAGELLVGSAIAVEGHEGSFEQRWAAVFGFRDEGAAWGLVVLDQGVAPEPLLRAVAGAVDRSSLSFSVPPSAAIGSLVAAPLFVATAPAAPSPAGSGSARSGASANGSRTGPGSHPPSTTPPPSAGTPPPVTVPPPPPSPVSPIVDPLVQLVNRVSGGLLGGTSR